MKQPRSAATSMAIPITLTNQELSARIAIEGVSFDIDSGRFPAKAVVGENFVFELDIFVDGHGVIGTEASVGPPSGAVLTTTLVAVANDRWRGSIVFEEIGSHQISVTAWRDRFASWQRDTANKKAAGLPVALELVEGRQLLEGACARAPSHQPLLLLAKAAENAANEEALFALLMTGSTTELMRTVGPRDGETTFGDRMIWVDRPKAVFSSWYELFPRSSSFSSERHGTFDDVIERLPYVADLGFDVLYFTPIHPIGSTNRKGRNNALVAGPHDPGSPYAIGSEAGGHDAIHPDLGDMASFRRLVQAAENFGLEIALDFAVQCSPDHPWLLEHPDWFEKRPDGSIKFAENPPKKYEDIVNPSFYDASFPDLWNELLRVVLFWVENGVRIFRVDNPHTKPLPFWEWLISEVRAAHPDVLFLSEAFTRPKMMLRLAKVGFSQSYTYFTWRNTKSELTQYLEELCEEPQVRVFRPNFFVNTPDINPAFLQEGGRPAHRIRAVLAASLSPSWGIYNGFEICDARALPGKEEYADSEKYQLRVWDFDLPGNIKSDIRFMNALRREHPALQQLSTLKFYNAWNDQVLYYGKRTADLEDFLLFAVNLDPTAPQEADFEIPLWEFGLPDDAQIAAFDHVTGEHFVWTGKSQRVRLTPDDRPYAVWSLLGPVEA